MFRLSLQILLYQLHNNTTVKRNGDYVYEGRLQCKFYISLSVFDAAKMLISVSLYFFAFIEIFIQLILVLLLIDYNIDNHTVRHPLQ